jgi:uncharacterized membrane protein YdjX (TVP38/TMEM64 family)
VGETRKAVGGTGKLKATVATAGGIGALLALWYFPLQDLLRSALAWIDGLGLLGALLFVALYVAACVFFVPGSLLTLGAGAVYGVLQGTALVSVASTLGATAAFLVGRYLARDWVARKIAGNARFRAVDEAVAREGWKIVGLTRLSPVFPFVFLNYAYGVTRVSVRDYVLASWIGMLPGTVLYVYLGSLAGDLARLGAGERTRTPGEWALYAVGLAATVAVTVYVTRIARAALARRA